MGTSLRLATQPACTCYQQPVLQTQGNQNANSRHQENKGYRHGVVLLSLERNSL